MPYRCEHLLSRARPHDGPSGSCFCPFHTPLPPATLLRFYPNILYSHNTHMSFPLGAETSVCLSVSLCRAGKPLIAAPYELVRDPVLSGLQQAKTVRRMCNNGASILPTRGSILCSLTSLTHSFGLDLPSQHQVYCSW